MWIAEIAERAIMAAMASLDVTFRASRVDNDESAVTERKSYPAMVIMAGGGDSDSIESLFKEVPLTVQIITHYEADPKCTTLAGLESQFMKIVFVGLESNPIRTAFDAAAVAAGETFHMKLITDISGGMVEKTDKQQTITINMTLHACGS